MEADIKVNLLRPNQQVEMKDEVRILEDKLQSPHIEDKGTVRRQLHRLKQQLEIQTPKPFVGAEVDAAVKREQDLREQILQGMPSQEEMRKSPPGAIDKHRTWEKRNKEKIIEWKNIQLRLHADSNEVDIANFERFRPTSSSLNMDNAFIPGNQYFMPPDSPQYRQNFDRVFPNAPGSEAKKEPKKRGRKPKPAEIQPEA